ncbi:hypothetical protein OAU13_00625 [bacterium]|nr:hypothetical protein [bacterium]
MKVVLTALLSLLLVGCGNPLTRILPKLEKLEVDSSLMEPPKELKIIEKPIQTPQSEITRDVPPER